MKKTVSVLLTLALLFGLVLALPSAPARAESTPEQELTEVFQNLNAVDSMRMDLDIVLDLSIVMSMGGQTIINMPLNVALKLGMEYQKEPYAMRGQMQMHMSYMGKTEDNQSLMYSEKDGDAVISYSSDDDGATWTKKQSEKASFSMDDMSAVIGSAKEIQKIGTESIDGHDMDVYTAIVDGQYLQKAMNAAGSDNPLSGIVGETGSEDGSNGLGDFEVTIYVDKETKLPVRFSIDLTSMMKDLMDAALKASMDMSEMEGMEVSVDIPTALIDCNLSQFNSVPPIEIPEEIKATEIPPKAQPLIMGTGAEAGSNYAFGTVLSNVINAHADDALSVTAVSSGGSRGNLDGLVSGEYQLGFVQSDVAASSLAADEKYAAVQALAGLYPIPVQIVTTNPDIKTLGDLKGRRIAVGAAGSAIFNTAEELLGAAGISIYEDVTLDYMSISDVAEDLKTGVVDAAFLVAMAPTKSVSELATAVPIYLVAVDDATLEAFLTAHPYYGRCILNKDAYDTGTDVQTVAIKAVLLASASLSEDDACAILAAIFNNRDEIAAAHDFGKMLDIQTAAEGLGAPLHPGAVKFYRDNGVQVPEV